MSDELLLYWSEAYTNRYVEALNADEGFQKAARKFDDTIVFRCFDTPEGLDVEATYRIVKGRVTVSRWDETAPHRGLRETPYDKKKAFARSSAPYAVWTKLDKGEMSVLDALRSPEYVVEGPKLRIMANIGVFQAMSAVGAKLPKRFA